MLTPRGYESPKVEKHVTKPGLLKLHTEAYLVREWVHERLTYVNVDTSTSTVFDRAALRVVLDKHCLTTGAKLFDLYTKKGKGEEFELFLDDLPDCMKRPHLPLAVLYAQPLYVVEIIEIAPKPLRVTSVVMERLAGEMKAALRELLDREVEWESLWRLRGSQESSRPKRSFEEHLKTE